MIRIQRNLRTTVHEMLGHDHVANRLALYKSYSDRVKNWSLLGHCRSQLWSENKCLIIYKEVLLQKTLKEVGTRV